MFRLENKTAVITGGGSGIGKAMSILFAQQGAKVHIIELSEENAASTVAEIKAVGGEAIAHSCNVANQKQVVDVFATIEKVDILINNAGIAHIGKADTTAEADFDRVMAVNVKGAYNCIFAAIPKLKLHGGVIINMASIGSNVGIADRFIYSTTKGAIKAMTMSVARDYISDKIRCNSISPARVHTPFVDGFLKNNYSGQEAEMFEKLSKSQPIGRMAEPVEIATLALYLCSNEASFITGCDYPIDGGFTTLNN
jgi:NAD(P)-dependent dehydrogenase (short-subunit alcohol dehydrogenase family)